MGARAGNEIIAGRVAKVACWPVESPDCEAFCPPICDPVCAVLAVAAGRRSGCLRAEKTENAGIATGPAARGCAGSKRFSGGIRGSSARHSRETRRTAGVPGSQPAESWEAFGHYDDGCKLGRRHLHGAAGEPGDRGSIYLRGAKQRRSVGARNCHGEADAEAGSASAADRSGKRRVPANADRRAEHGDARDQQPGRNDRRGGRSR